MAVRIEDKPGVAFYQPDTCDEHEHCVIAIMVGDDYKWHVDPNDVHALPDDDFCGGCGQIGCGHGG